MISEERKQLNDLGNCLIRKKKKQKESYKYPYKKAKFQLYCILHGKRNFDTKDKIRLHRMEQLTKINCSKLKASYGFFLSLLMRKINRI